VNIIQFLVFNYELMRKLFQDLRATQWPNLSESFSVFRSIHIGAATVNGVYLSIEIILLSSGRLLRCSRNHTTHWRSQKCWWKSKIENFCNISLV